MGQEKGIVNTGFTETESNAQSAFRNGHTDVIKHGDTQTYGTGSAVKSHVKQEPKPDDNDSKYTWASFREEFRINKELLPVKFAMLCFHGGVFAFLPYVTLHMKQIGMTNEEVGLTYAILPVSSILGPLISGIVADKLAAFKAVFLFNVICAALFHTLFVTVPYAPHPPSLSFSCGGQGGQLAWSPPSCHIPSQSSSEITWQDMNVTLKNCKRNCLTQEVGSNSEAFCLVRANESVCFEHSLNTSLELTMSIGSSSSNTSLVSPGAAAPPTCYNEAPPSLGDLHFEGKTYERFSCTPSCTLECSVEGGPKPQHFHAQQYSTTFWVYLALRMPGQFFLAAAMTMMDALTMAVIANRGGDFGKQRLMSMLSLALMPFISSAIVTNVPTDNGSPDYTVAFYFGDALLVVAVIITACIKLERPDSSSQNVFQDLKQLMKKADILVFLAVILVLGSNWGFLESFFFVYLSELKAPAYLLGLTLTFGCLVGLPAMFLSNRIIDCVGRANIFILSFVAYSVRMFGYSIISNPWMSFPFEALEIITYQLMWVAAVTYFPILAPPTLLATMSGLSGTLHYNVGRGVGALMGGNLIGKIGSVNTFRVFGVISLVSGIIYTFVHYFFFAGKVGDEEKKQTEVVELKTDSKKQEAGLP